MDTGGALAGSAMGLTKDLLGLGWTKSPVPSFFSQYQVSLADLAPSLC